MTVASNLWTRRMDSVRALSTPCHQPITTRKHRACRRVPIILLPYGKPVNPDITLHWEAGNSLALLRGTSVYTNEIQINAKTTAWPLDYAVRALDSEFSFRIFARGQATGSGKAE